MRAGWQKRGSPARLLLFGPGQQCKNLRNRGSEGGGERERERERVRSRSLAGSLLGRQQLWQGLANLFASPMLLELSDTCYVSLRYDLVMWTAVPTALPPRAAGVPVDLLNLVWRPLQMAGTPVLLCSLSANSAFWILQSLSAHPPPFRTAAGLRPTATWPALPGQPQQNPTLPITLRAAAKLEWRVQNSLRRLRLCCV